MLQLPLLLMLCIHPAYNKLEGYISHNNLNHQHHKYHLVSFKCGNKHLYLNKKEMSAVDDMGLSASCLPPAALLLMLNFGNLSSTVDQWSKQPQAGGDLLLSIH